MRILTIVVAAIAAAGGYMASQARTPVVADEHAGHGDHAAGGLVAVDAGQSAAIPASGVTAAQRIAASPRHGEWVAIKVGASDSVMAWVVYPERSQKAPVVIAIHENTGLNTWTRSVADQLAAEGFIGIAPDMITMAKTGSLTEEATADVGRQLIQRATPEFVNAALDAVAKYGMSLPAAQPRYGVIGFCWGGGTTNFLAVALGPDLQAAAPYYGVAAETALLQELADRWTLTLHAHAEHWAAVYPMTWHEAE